MASRSLAMRLPRTIRLLPTRIPQIQTRHASSAEPDLDTLDPNMNGRYINPPPGKRALRDPYGDWWDKQERRNFGEPVHEDNDLYAVFSTEPYTHTTPGKAGFQISCFVAATLGLCGAVYQVYPDRPAVKKSFPAGLETELGGKGAWTARQEDEEEV